MRYQHHSCMVKLLILSFLLIQQKCVPSSGQISLALLLVVEGRHFSRHYITDSYEGGELSIHHHSESESMCTDDLTVLCLFSWKSSSSSSSSLFSLIIPAKQWLRYNYKQKSRTNFQQVLPFFNRRTSRVLVAKSSFPPKSWNPTSLSIAIPFLK